MTAAVVVQTAEAEHRRKQIFLNHYIESKVKKVIGIVSGKGGVGKSMTTSLLGVAAMKRVAYSNS